MEKANQRIKMLERDLKKLDTKTKKKAGSDDSDDDDDDDDLDDAGAIRIELEELISQNKARQATLDEYEKNKKWNVDNMFEVKEERTLINANAAKTNYTPTGFAQSTVTGEEVKKKFAEKEKDNDEDDDDKVPAKSTDSLVPAAVKKEAPKPASKPAEAHTTKKSAAPKVGPSPKKTPTPPSPTEVDSDPNFVYSYHEFTEKYADTVEKFMTLKTFDESKEFLLQHGEIILQEHASNYLLLASLEDEMNGYREKMKQTAKQSQIVTNIAELAKSWNTHPGNVILPFFSRLQQREFLEGFLAGMETFVQKIISRAVTKKMEIDQAQRSGVEKDGVDIAQIPKEERLGPGGLDPLEVIETLPTEMQEAFESRDVEKLKEVLLKMDPKDAEYHMKRCVDSGLWQAG
jgi:cell division cycle protein 37